MVSHSSNGDLTYSGQVGFANRLMTFLARLSVLLKRPLAWLAASLCILAVAILVYLTKWRALDSNSISAALSPWQMALGYGIMYALYVLLFAALLLIYVPVVTLRPSRFVGHRAFARQVIDALGVTMGKEANQRWAAWKIIQDQVLPMSRGGRGYLGQVLNGLRAEALATRQALEKHFKERVRDIEETGVWYVNVATMIMFLAPILGFLGTLLGMIQAFEEMEKGVGGAMTADGFRNLAYAIRVALVTTVYGLVIRFLTAIIRFAIIRRIKVGCQAVMAVVAVVEEPDKGMAEVAQRSADQ